MTAQTSATRALADRPGHGQTRVVLRTGLRRDASFITSTWLRSYRRFGARGMDRRVYYYWHHKLLEELLPSSNVIVACDADDPDRIHGWGCASYDSPTLVIHYLYTRDSLRRQGVARAILQRWRERYEPTSIAWTHQTDHGKQFVRACAADLPGIYNPYLARVAPRAKERL